GRQRAVQAVQARRAVGQRAQQEAAAADAEALRAGRQVVSRARPTYYQVFVGKRSVFDGQRKVSIEQVQQADGVQNTLLIVEAGKPVPWTKPEDLPFEAGKPLPKLGGLFPDGFHAVFCDYSTRFIPKDTPEDKIRALITWQGGEKV